MRRIHCPDPLKLATRARWYTIGTSSNYKSISGAASRIWCGLIADIPASKILNSESHGYITPHSSLWCGCGPKILNSESRGYNTQKLSIKFDRGRCGSGYTSYGYSNVRDDDSRVIVKNTILDVISPVSFTWDYPSLYLITGIWVAGNTRKDRRSYSEQWPTLAPEFALDVFFVENHRFENKTWNSAHFLCMRFSPVTILRGGK